MNTMNPYVIYAMVAVIIAAGYCFMKYLDGRDSNHNSAISE